jgi:hypothetical protein
VSFSFLVSFRYFGTVASHGLWNTPELPISRKDRFRKKSSGGAASLTRLPLSGPLTLLYRAISLPVKETELSPFSAATTQALTDKYSELSLNPVDTKISNRLFTAI